MYDVIILPNWRNSTKLRFLLLFLALLDFILSLSAILCYFIYFIFYLASCRLFEKKKKKKRGGGGGGWRDFAVEMGMDLVIILIHFYSICV